MFPPIFVLRHGQTEWNAVERMQGRMNSPLTETGQQQARHQGQLLRQHDLTGFRFYCSPQGRAFQTAALALDGLAHRVDTDSRLVEISMGDWEGRTRPEIAQEAPHLFDDGMDFVWYDHAPGGEGLTALYERARDFLNDLDGPAVLVTHGMTSRFLRVAALGWSPDRFSELPGGQGNMYLIKNGEQTIFS